MGKLRVFSGRELCDLLESSGFQPVRCHGSHQVMQRRTPIGTTTIPVPLHSEIRIGTLVAIIRQSGLSRALFEA